jgi:hypothetical protein
MVMLLVARGFTFAIAGMSGEAPFDEMGAF